MASLPLNTFSSSSPESDNYWDEIFKTERTTQSDYEESTDNDEDVDDLDIDPLERDED